LGVFDAGWDGIFSRRYSEEVAILKFGFLAHPTTLELQNQVRAIDLLNRISEEMRGEYRREIWGRRDAVPVAEIGPITSATGSCCEGILHYLPMTAEEIFSHRRSALQRVSRAVRMLHDHGAKIVGLGGATSIIGENAKLTAESSPVPVTSGNSLTAYSTLRTLMAVRKRVESSPEELVAIVGYPGSIALVVAKLLVAQGVPLHLIHRRFGQDPTELARVLGNNTADVRLSTAIEEAYASCRFFVAATSTGSVIDSEALRPGSIVIDVALPRDVRVGVTRSDVLIIDGGYVSALPSMHIRSALPALAPSSQINGCIGETIVLALEQRGECFSIGVDLYPEKVMEIGAAAERHGLTCDQLRSFGRPIRAWQWESIEKAREERSVQFNRSAVEPDIPRKSTIIIQPEMSTSKSGQGDNPLTSFRAHMNPVMADFLELNHLDRVFVKARGCSLWDGSGNEYLDFVAGYGCLNTGHNHPAIIQALHKFFVESSPVFVQYISVPSHAPLLAERLCAIAPGRMERVFFSNSGAEAVEAALKLARAATGRDRIVYCSNSYHGKTLGALSVTGRERHRGPFHPLVPACVCVPFGDVAALDSALSEGHVAGFIVEPVQGEGGVQPAPAGYLREAHRLCAAAGALFIVDEIQTGLGRTGTMFACEHEGVSPDVICLAKSLSGGVVPIGATLCAAGIWDAAYGDSSKFALHTSTFGGNNFAASAGLVALDVIEREDLALCARRVGSLLHGALVEIARKYNFIREVRGRGLMLGIEFEHSYRGAIGSTAELMATRLPGDWHLLYQFLPDNVRQLFESAAKGAENALEDMFCLQLVAKLNQDHRILTFMTANNNRVMRIQPPLVLTEAQAQRFVTAFEETCEDLSTCVV
jgi:acetylornithine/succinyldiaminopimelate/putrescine aminotransferase/predicted amino acid dehydrogenase